MGKKSFLSSLSGAVTKGLSKADEAMDKAGDKISEAGDKIKGVVAGESGVFVNHTLADMTEVADMLNEALESDEYKTLKVLGTAQNKDDGVDVLMFVVKN